MTKPCFLSVPETIFLSLNCSDKSISRPNNVFRSARNICGIPEGSPKPCRAFPGELRSSPGQALLRSFSEGGGGPGGASGGGGKGSRGSNLNCLTQFPFSGLIPFCCGKLRSRAAGEPEAEHRKLNQSAENGQGRTGSEGQKAKKRRLAAFQKNGAAFRILSPWIWGLFFGGRGRTQGAGGQGQSRGKVLR